MVNTENYKEIVQQLGNNVKLVAVSKTKLVEDILALYNMGQRDFAENYVQELEVKHKRLPGDIHWHYIGHLQSNKVKQIASFAHLIQSVDSLKLLKEINKQAQKNNRVINCLLQIHIAQEETKFGLDELQLQEILNANSKHLYELKNVKIVGLMGMASFTDDVNKVSNEFRCLKLLFDKYTKLSTDNFQFTILSMGMSADYKIAIKEGSNMVRIGSLLFGDREITKN